MKNEIILLNAITDIIDEMINKSLFTLVGKSPNCNILFHSSIHQKLFNILLVDFLSQTDIKAPIPKTSYLKGLKEIIEKPSFDSSSIKLLKDSVRNFINWLKQEITVNIHLPTLEIETDITIIRISFLKMIGNISKHNYLRSMGVVKELNQYLSNSNINISLEDTIFVLDDFYERFHNDILNYHSSTIVEHLNNIRWGIKEYLENQYKKSSFIEYLNSDFTITKYHYPKNLKSQFEIYSYNNLMNKTKKEPYIEKFKVTEILKKRY